jgi:DNA-binding CsgD family transcriptional regulator
MTAHPGARQFGPPAEGWAAPSAKDLPSDVLLEIMDLIGLAIMLTGPSGQIVYTNKAARLLLSDSKVVQQCHGRLKALCRRSSADLQSALELAAGHDAFVPKHGVVVPLYDIDGMVRAASWVLPLSSPRAEAAAPRGGRYVVFIIRELTHETAISVEFFTRCYGITRAERRLLEMLSEGMTVFEAGQSLGVSANTTKTHLRGLFAKTGTRRQADLMRLAATTLPPAARCRG